MRALGFRLRERGTRLQTIRVRLTLWYVGILAGILVAFSAFLYLNLSHNLLTELDRSLNAEAQPLLATLEVQNGQVIYNETSDPLETSGTGSVITLYDPTGARVITTSGRPPLIDQTRNLAASAPAQPSFATVTLPGDAWRVLTMRIDDNGRIVGVLQVARSQQEIAVAQDQLVTLMAIAIPTILLLAVAGGLFLAGRALGPIDRITRAAEQLGAEGLSRRLNFSGTDDEVGRLATAFDRMLDRLERAFRRQRQFTADASHELRTPLTLLVSQADLALERSRTSAEYRRILTSVRDDARRMTQLVGDLLTLARADADQNTLAREPLDLSDLVGEVVTALEPLAQARGVKLERGSTEPVVVMGDQTRLAQLLVNLADNGLKYTPTGGGVIVSVQRKSGSAILTVADSGVGIALEHLPHLFERFYRVDEARSRAEGGAGLGLAISRWIAEAHGGTITVASRLGQGTTFTVSLPETPASVARDCQPPPSVAPVLSSAHPPGTRSTAESPRHR